METIMATDDQNGDESRNNPDFRGTYDRFMTITKWAVIGIAGALILMALLLA